MPLKSINDLSTTILHLEIGENTYEFRKKIRIAVIDDESFQPEVNLRRNNYNITTFTDLNTIEDVQSYHIILCDLSGVGLAQNPDLQGAHLISEIKKAYPEKSVIAYTGGSSSRELYGRAMLQADTLVPKDANIDEWTQTLDEAIQSVANPVKVWKSTRSKLLEADVSLSNLAILEHEFVKAFEKGKDINLQKLSKKANKLKISNNAQKIITSLVANSIIKLATNGVV